jgi:hypothetical protein
MNTILKIEICDLVISGYFSSRKIRIQNICNAVCEKYPIKYSNYLYVNIRKSVVEIFPNHRNKQKRVKIFKVSRLKAAKFLEGENIRMRCSYVD